MLLTKPGTKEIVYGMSLIDTALPFLQESGLFFIFSTSHCPIGYIVFDSRIRMSSLCGNALNACVSKKGPVEPVYQTVINNFPTGMID